jgi:copper chaperone CopZ
MTTELTIDGMTCQNCVRHVTEALSSVRGVASASVSLETRRASVHGEVEPFALIAAVEEAGYEAAVL